MSRHNREGYGEDHHGHRYRIFYHPDWLGRVKVTRSMKDGRPSTRTLFRAPDEPRGQPGPLVRTHIEAPELGLSVFVHVTSSVRRVTVQTVLPGVTDVQGVVTLTLYAWSEL